jgi:glycosyltransferase involved in cell wall biosynthesis
MKIAVFHNLPLGGAKRALYGFVKYLVRAGYHIEVFLPSTANEEFLPLKQIVKKVRIFPFLQTPLGFLKSTLNYLLPLRLSLADLEKTQKRIASLINKGEYEVVFVEQDQYTMSPFILKYLKKPSVYYCQQPRRSGEAILKRISENIENNLPKSFWKKIWRKYATPRLEGIDRKNASFAKMILTNSYFSRENILRVYGLNSFVCYLGVDREVFQPLNLPRQSYVLSVGALTSFKGFDFIINSLALIEEKIRPPLVIVGNVVWKSWRIYLEELAAKKGVKLEIKVLVDDSELVKIYNQAKLCLYAPYLEPFGLVILESMSCGTPVVAVKEGGIREIIRHNETGILTDRDEKEFAEVVTQLLRDKRKHHFLSQNSQEAISCFWNLEQAIQRLLKHLERAIKIY